VSIYFYLLTANVDVKMFITPAIEFGKMIKYKVKVNSH